MACKFGALIASSGVTAADRDLLVKWCEDGTDVRGRRVSADAMSRAVSVGAGVLVGPTTLKDHRGGRCACYREKASA